MAITALRPEEPKTQGGAGAPREFNSFVIERSDNGGYVLRFGDDMEMMFIYTDREELFDALSKVV